MRTPSTRTPTRALLRTTLLTLLFAAAPAFAGDPATLPAWEQLTQAQRDQLIAPVRERWNAEPAQRTRMLERARRWQQMSPDQRHRAHRGMRRWEHMSPENRVYFRALFEKMRELEPAQRDELRQRWRAMTPEQRKAWVEANPPRSPDSGHPRRRHPRN
ncbi:DUF3106 domain-containing protein [Montanilutibacter psychrotolerans]|uniref:DUF3106 domain-containing protein n=1 Tax=Montanilutibacter psychrotolerans TaxID=1327343 RepID=A0A3M8T0B4_9GAMM|nr:DUF3106 domain-containing protein [Lysobacter psychrotolerans]RNF84142.1 DUF3106 domain-containing protein [Lysobacter psychrotolerans]